MLRGSIRRLALALGGSAIAVLATAASGWACASVAALDFTPGVAEPGQQVDVLVTFTNKDRPVELRWEALDGPLLATIDPATFTEGLHGNWRFARASITVPPDAAAGSHIVIASQEAVRGTATWGMPARGLLQVSTAGSPIVGQQPGPGPVVRPADLVSEDSVGAGEMALVSLGAAGLTLLLGGIGFVMVSARRDRQAAATVSTESRS